MHDDTSTGGDSPVAPTVHLVDDDPMVASALGRLLRSHGYEVVLHDHGQAFLDAYRPGRPACAVVDIVMPVMDGLALQASLLELPERPALVFLSGLADIPVCATAMRRGAIDFLTTPVDEERLLAAIRTALERDAEAHAKRAYQRAVEERFARLTGRECEVLGHVARGRLNKQIAYDLGIAEKTVKVHRARAMDKVGARSVAALVKLLERSTVVLEHDGDAWPGQVTVVDLPCRPQPQQQHAAQA